MKKVIALIGILVMTMALVACGQASTSDSAATQGVTEAVTEVGTEATSEAGTEAATETVISQGDETASTYPLTIIDKYDNEIVIEAQPQTIISMSPELTEIIYALGAGEKLIGRSSYCNFPAETAEVQDYGTLFDLNIESIVASAPDVVFLTSMASEELVDALLDNGLVVIAIDKDSDFEGTYQHFAIVGSILGEEPAAQALTMKVKEEIAAVEAKVAGLEQPSVYYIVYAGDGYDSTATGDTFIHGMIETAGGNNIAKEGQYWSYSVETLVEQDPDMIFCSNEEGNKARIQGLEGYKELTAVMEDRLYEVNADIFSRQGPRVGQAIEVMAKLIHPEAFE